MKLDLSDISITTRIAATRMVFGPRLRRQPARRGGAIRPLRYTLVGQRLTAYRSVHSAREATMRRSTLATALVAVFISEW